jgi:hypothetical protein
MKGASLRRKGRRNKAKEEVRVNSVRASKKKKWEGERQYLSEIFLSQDLGFGSEFGTAIQNVEVLLQAFRPFDGRKDFGGSFFKGLGRNNDARVKNIVLALLNPMSNFFTKIGRSGFFFFSIVTPLKFTNKHHMAFLFCTSQ